MGEDNRVHSARHKGDARNDSGQGYGVVRTGDWQVRLARSAGDYWKQALEEIKKREKY